MPIFWEIGAIFGELGTFLDGQGIEHHLAKTRRPRRAFADTLAQILDGTSVKLDAVKGGVATLRDGRTNRRNGRTPGLVVMAPIDITVPGILHVRRGEPFGLPLLYSDHPANPGYYRPNPFVRS